jgi:3-hydroxybutyryl-CoA dehydrogenase
VQVGVIGGGRMGSGIAQVFATVGAEVTVVESDTIAAKAALTRVETGLRRAAERGKLDGTPTQALSRIDFVTEIPSLPKNADLVVEAVPEAPELKVRVLTAVELAVATDTVVATNTSSLSIGELGAVLVHPGRFLGMHFFNPVPVSKLVEIVLGPNTRDDVRDKALEWVRLIGKADVVVRDSPGFATSRLGVMLGLEAIRMLEDGVTDAESIDRAMELGYGHPMGPLRSTDLVGLDVRLAIAEYLERTLGDRFAPPKLLREKVERGELGRKSGQGFYAWN